MDSSITCLLTHYIICKIVSYKIGPKVRVSKSLTHIACGQEDRSNYYFDIACEMRR
jgi:hypothetical protein